MVTSQTEPPCAICSVKLEQPSGPAVCVDIPLGGLVLFHAAFCHLEAEPQHIQRLLVAAVLIQFLDHSRHILFPQTIDRNPLFFQPPLQLGYRIRIFQTG